MPRKPSIEVLGGKELQAILSKLPAEMEAKGARAILRSGATVFRNKMKDLAPVGDDKIYNAIKMMDDRNDKTAIHVGVTTKAFWARFYEFGTVVRKTKKGANRGQMTDENAFVQRAIDAALKPAIDAIFKQGSRKLANFLKRELRKGKKTRN
jgi:HK97 gp10 family phage protein